MSLTVSTTDGGLGVGIGLSWLTQKMILRSGRSWWMVRYQDGSVLHEWDTLQPEKAVSLTIPEKRSLARAVADGFKNTLLLQMHTAGSTSRWEDIPKRNMRGLYLVCPDGLIHAMEANGDYLFFQLKVGYLAVGSGGSCKAHIIGKVDGDDGRCTCWAYEFPTQPGEIGKHNRFTDNVTHMAYEGIGPLNLDVVGLK